MSFAEQESAAEETHHELLVMQSRGEEEIGVEGSQVVLAARTA